MFPRQLLTLAMVMVVWLLTLYGFEPGNQMFLLLPIVFPLMVLFVSRPEIWMVFMVAIQSSELKFPQAPANLNAFHIIALGFIVFALFYRMMYSTAGRIKSPANKYAVAFGALLLFTGAYRGFGLRAMGSSLWGGAPYVVLLISLGLFLTIDILPLSPRQWRNALIAMCALAFLPTVAQLIYVFSGGRIYQHYAFIAPKGVIVEAMQAVEDEKGIARFATNAGVLLAYVPLILFEKPLKGPRALVTIAFIAAALISAALSGSRYSVILMVFFCAVWALTRGGRFDWHRALAIGVVATIIVGGSALYASHFPLSIQRSLTFLPWADVSVEAKTDATNTSTWRMDLWKRAIHEDLPRYWLIGRGFAFDRREYEMIRTLRIEFREWAFVTGTYHHGILSLLINLGLFGLIFGIAFIVSNVREHWRRFKQVQSHPLLCRMYHVILAMFVSHTFLFFTLGGDVQNYFPSFVFQATILQGLARTQESLDQASEATPSPS